ncbi:MAG: hypothetical protein IPG94_04755 [Kineosporiaceae bacterium]|nr:hypothetical protein [Kineosporiaceae bacterium]
MLGHPDGAEEEPVRRFVTDRARHGAHAHILSVCNGGKVVAATGLLDGHRARAHWSRLGVYRTRRPLVDWVDGQRYVDTTVAAAGGTTTITSTARLVGYPGWPPDASTTIPV